VTTPDRKSLDAAAELMWPKAPVYVASLPKDSSETQLAVAVRLHELGLRPVPHIVARNLPSEAAFERAVERFATEAGVDRALVLAGDRDDAQGPFESSLELIRSGVFEANGIRRIAIAAIRRDIRGSRTRCSMRLDGEAGSGRERRLRRAADHPALLRQRGDRRLCRQAPLARGHGEPADRPGRARRALPGCSNMRRSAGGPSLRRCGNGSR
jgi:hypothetical protein